MAINTQKLLSQANTTSTSITLPPQDKKNVNTIRVRTIQVDKILKGTLAADKKRLTDKKKEASKQRKEDIETKLEKKPDSKDSKKITMPKILPKTGILDWIKNYIGNILLGYFAIRMLKHLPKLKKVFTGIMAVGEFIIDWGGKILNGLVTFVDWGYKAYDATLGFIKTVGGDGLVSLFTKFSGVVDVVIATLIAATIAIAAQSDQVSDLLGDLIDPKKKPKGKVKPKVKPKFKPKFRGGPGRGVPILSTILAIFDFGSRKAAGESTARAATGTGGGILGGIAGAALAATLFPEPTSSIAGVITLGILGTLGYNFGAMTGDAVSDTAGFAKGGNVRAKRRIKSNRGKKIAAAPHIPTAKLDPGKNISGTITDDKGKQESKIFGLFPNPFAGKESGEKTDWDPLKFIAERGDKFSEMGYFGPISSLSLKSIVGQKPTDKDYDNAARGLSALQSSRTLGFASGGIVDQDIVEKEWLKNELKKSFIPLVDKTLDEIKSNLELEVGDVARQNPPDSMSSDHTGIDSPSGAHSGHTSGTIGGQWGPVLDLISSVEGVSYDSVYPGTTKVKYSGGKPLYEMTIGEAHDWQTQTYRARGSAAAGKYQFMDIQTQAASYAGLGRGDMFSALNQDKMAIGLIEKKRKITLEMLKNNPAQAQIRIAKEWAGIPVGTSMRGHKRQVGPEQSYYAGDGRNASGTSTAKVRAAFAQVVGGGSGERTISTTAQAIPNAGATMAGDVISKEGVTDAASSLDVSNLGGKKRIYLHWSAGGYTNFSGLNRYNIMYGKEGDRHVSSGGLTQNGHTMYRSDGVGLSAAAMGGAGEKNFGSSPITSAQMWAMANDAAVIAKAMGYSNVTDKQVQTHGEAGSGTADNDELNLNYGGVDVKEGGKWIKTPKPDNYGPAKWHGIGARWDLDKLEQGKEIGSGGPTMRKMINSKLKEYWKGGYTKGSKHQITVGERGKEFVMDADSTRALDDTFPGILSALNKADYSGTLKVLRNYTQYEVGGGGQSQILPFPVEVPVAVPVPGNSGGFPSNSNGNSGLNGTEVLEKI